MEETSDTLGDVDLTMVLKSDTNGVLSDITGGTDLSVGADITLVLSALESSGKY